MFFYNISLFNIFWVLKQTIVNNTKTIHAFSDLKFNSFYIITLTLSILSMAGIPPFLGFFSKVLILVLITNSNFFFFIFFFLILLFLGLYFYLQNIRYMYSTNQYMYNNIFTINIHITNLSFLILTFFNFITIFGFFFFNDFLLYFYWLFI